MACMKLGSKPQVFRLHGHTWHCSSGLPSDVIIEIGEFSFHLHKFPLLSRSRTLEDLIGDSSDEDNKCEDLKRCILELRDIPGGAKAFLLVAKFCYGVKTELTATNVVSLRCAAEYLQMTEDYGEGNLIAQTESFLNQVFCNWVDTIKALESCEEVISHAEELHIVSRCINSLAMKACADPTLLSWPAVSGNPAGTVLWNGIRTSSKSRHVSQDWWYEDVSFLRLPLYKRLILAVGARGMKPERIAGSLMHYTQKYIPLTGRQSSFHNGNRTTGSGSFVPPTSEADQRALLEQIVELLPDQKGVIQTKLLLRILRTSMILRSSLSCREALEKRVGTQLDDAVLEDILIPNMGYSVETLYDIDCVKRIVEHFMLVEKDASDDPSASVDEAGQLIGDSHSLTPLTIVGNLVDSYLAEVAPDVNLKLTKFESLAALIPEYARPLDDGIYRAIDIYLKAHPRLTDTEREQLCNRLMNCQKLSLEASTHAAQNERLPLRVIVQVLFFEQLRLRTSVAGCFFVSDNSQDSTCGNLPLLSRRDDDQERGNRRILDDIMPMAMGERVSELEKECSTMKQEIEKLVKTRGSWNNLFKMLGLKLKSKTGKPPGKATTKKPCSAKISTPSAAAAKLLLHGKQNQAKRAVELGC